MTAFDKLLFIVMALIWGVSFAYITIITDWFHYDAEHSWLNTTGKEPWIIVICRGQVLQEPFFITNSLIVFLFPINISINFLKPYAFFSTYWVSKLAINIQFEDECELLNKSYFLKSFTNVYL